MSAQGLPPQPPLDGSIPVLPGFLDFHAQHSPANPAFIYPDPDTALTSCAATSYQEFADATHRVAHVLRPSRAGPERAVVAIFVHTDVLLFHAVLVGLVRAGLVPFGMSPRNSAPAVVSMLERTDCHRIISQPAFASLTDAVRAVLPPDYLLEVDNLPALADVFPAFLSPSAAPPPPVTPYPPSAKPPARSDVVLYLHSSGSTGFPKPIPQTDIMINGWTNNSILTEGRDRGIRWGVAPLPAFHTLGMEMQLYASLSSGLPVSLYAPRGHLGVPPPMPTPANTLENARQTNANAVVSVPAFLEAWAQDDESIAYLSTLRIVPYSGGPLSTANGNKLAAAGVPLFAVYGGTEFGAPTSVFDRDVDPPAAHTPANHNPAGKTQDDWAWMQFPAQVSVRWVPQGDGSYELVYLTCSTHQPSVENLPDGEKGYASSDLWEQHPAKPGLWRLVGRTDDVIVLGTGEKIVPIPQEGHIAAHPALMGAVVFGRGRQQPGVLVEPKPGHTIMPGDQRALIEFRNKIWKQIEEANVPAPAFGRLFKEMILVGDPERPFPRAAKGTVVRKQTLALYEADIDALYKTVEDSTDAKGILPPPSWTEAAVEAWLAEHAASIIDKKISIPTVDLFEHGFDSLSATFLRNRIIGALRSSADVDAKAAAPHVQPDFIFTHPTLAALAGAISSLVRDGGSAAVAGKTPVADMEALIAQYTALLPAAFTVPVPKRDGAVVLITGTTGSLGSNVLAVLLADPRVMRVYALNRGVELVDRQRAVFAHAQLPVELLDSSKLRLLSGEILREDLGLQSTVLDEIRASVTDVVHNAWRVDFNLTLSSFQPHIGAAVRLASLVPGARFVFTSSITSALAWPLAQGRVPETPLGDPAVAVGTGYGMSKFVVEEVLANARKAGLKTTTLRIGQVCGPAASGVWNTTEWVPIMVKSGIALGSFPELGGVVSWIPMDAVARAIVDASLAEDAPVLVNVTHPRPVPFTDILTAISDALGRNIPFEPLKSWVAKLKHVADGASVGDLETIPAIKLLGFFENITAQEKGIRDVEAGGVPMFETTEAQKMSPTLLSLSSLGKDEANAWVQYWRSGQFIV
ncbi:hypothetical protein B0H21DRAFT_822721 [Amylocystis lapponica]|nr:hypothetical protein B0H21DRAFT_822721 [Amylocystis lapponica]